MGSFKQGGPSKQVEGLVHCMGKTRGTILVYLCERPQEGTDGPRLPVIELSVICIAIKWVTEQIKYCQDGEKPRTLGLEQWLGCQLFQLDSLTSTRKMI